MPVAPGLGAVVRGGWTGFVVLFIGDLVTLYHGRGDGLILYWVAVAAYAVAGNRAAAPSVGVVRTAARDGAGAAMAAYLLTIPLRAAGGGSVSLLGTVVALAAAVVVGGAAGAIAARGWGRRRRPAAGVAGPPGLASPPGAAGAPVAGGAVGSLPADPLGAGPSPEGGVLAPPAGGGTIRVEGRWPLQRDVLELADGRQVQWIAAGPEDGVPLVLHHGTPGACGAWRGMVGTAAAAGMRVVTYSRPGYGGSSARPGRRVADVAADVAALLDRLGAERFVTLGWSTGGPCALACAALLPGRCQAAAVLAGPAPPSSPGLDWLAGVEPDRAAEWALARQGRAALEAALDPVVGGLATLGKGELLDEIGEPLAEVDQRALAAPFADYLASAYRAGLAAGAAGWRDDDLALVQPWGFDPARLDVPVGLWWGTEDRVVPPAHGRWMATHLPGAAGHECIGEGHLSIATSVLGEVVDAVAVAIS